MTTELGVTSQDFLNAKKDIDKILNNEAGADAKLIRRCGIALRDFIGKSPSEMATRDLKILSAIRRAVSDVRRYDNTDNAELYNYVMESVTALCNIRTITKEPREYAGRLCDRLSHWLMPIDEDRACQEGRMMPSDTPFVEARVN